MISFEWHGWLLYMFLAFSVIALYCWDSEHYFSKWCLLFLTAACQADLPLATSFPNVPSFYQSGSWASERFFKIFKVSTLSVLQHRDVTMMSVPCHMPASILWNTASRPLLLGLMPQNLVLSSTLLINLLPFLLSLSSPKSSHINF